MENKKIIIYDFDGTLTPYSLPKFEILEKCGLSGGALNPDFIKMAKSKAVELNVSLYNALYETYFELLKKAGFKLNNDSMILGSDNVDYNKGVVQFLKNLNTSDIDNYLLSSGIKVFLENTSISKYFQNIFATTFIYDEYGEVVDIDFLMDDKSKVSVIDAILKENGILNNDCSNIIYIGDGLTDMYAMEFVKKNNGTTIFVYNDEKSAEIEKIKEKDVVSLFTLADFSLDSELSNYINQICNINRNKL